MTADIERNLKYGTDKQKLEIFNTVTGKNLTNAADIPNIGDIMWYVSDIFTMGVQYGGRVEMCNFLTNGTWFNTTTMLYDYKAFSIYAGKKAQIDEYDALNLAKTDATTTNVFRQWTW